MNKCNCTTTTDTTPKCAIRTTIDYVPNTACTIGVTTDGVTDTLSLKQGIINCETDTRLLKTPGTITYRGERFLSSGGASSYEQVINSRDVVADAVLEDLSNVDDGTPQPGDILVYQADPNCGPNCFGLNDSWVRLSVPQTGKYHLVSNNGVLSWEEVTS